MKKNSLSVILPTLNEEGNIIPLINSILKYQPLEIINVDDNSQDNTIKLVRTAAKKDIRIKLIVNNPRLGLTPSIQSGINKAKGAYVCWMDADFSHPPELIPKMLAKMNNADIAVGSWLIPGGKDLRIEKVPKLMSLCINTLSQVLFGSEIKAYTSGFILMKKKFFQDFELRGDYGEYCIDLLVRQKRLKRKIAEVPFICKSREKGETKTAPNLKTLIKRGSKYIRTVGILLMELHKFTFV